MSLHVALESLLPVVAPGASVIDGLQRLSGGATQEIWRFDAVRPGGNATLILRRAPGGDRVSDIGVGLDVEARLMAEAAEHGIPVPPVRHVLCPSDGLGQGFIMDFVEGETLGGRIARSPAFAGARLGLARQCGETLARIHAINPGLFPTLQRLTPDESVAQWRAAYLASVTVRPVFVVALRWLASNCPPPAAASCVVHGDFRNGNLMVGPEGLRAVLDWELAHVGDPMEDLGWLCVNSWRFGEIGKPVGGFGQVSELWAGYEAVGGARVDPASARWWQVFGTLRWGVICAGALASFRGEDPGVERALIARRTSETEIDLLRLLSDETAHA